MDIEWYIKVFGLFLLIIISALLSGSETALSSLTKEFLKNYKKKNFILSEYISELIEFPIRYKTSIVIVNSIILILEVLISIGLADSISEYFLIVKPITLITILILLTFINIIFVEILPKSIAKKHSVIYSQFISIPLYWITILIYPIKRIFSDVLNFILLVVSFKKLKNKFLLKRIKSINELNGNIQNNRNEEKIIVNSLESFKEITVREIMTPRVDITAISDETSFNELIKIINESSFSRIPLYKGNLDNIIGIIYTKDLLSYLRNDNNTPKLNFEKIARKPMFVPETKLISDLMREFQEKNLHLSIVVDEYGGTAGLISLEDILEEIIGEIRDEYDKEENDITKINDNTFIILGKTSIDEVNKVLGINLYPEEDYYDTLGGFVLNYSGFIPQTGYSLIYKNHKFTVKEITNRRINKIQVEKLSEG